jgi:prophage tail gpP-like protein
MDTVELEGPFNPNDRKTRDTFRPLSYKPFGVFVNDEPLFEGIMANITTRMSADSFEFAVGAYAPPAEQSELMVPVEKIPTEFRGQNLHEIARTLMGYYDVEIDPRVQPGPIFKKVKIEPDQSVMSFLVQLAQQRNQVLASSETGALVFWRAITSGVPVAILEQGQSPLLNVDPVINPAEYFSEVTGLKPIKVRSKKKARYTAGNPFLRSEQVFRPFTFTVPDTEVGDVEIAVRAKLSRMFGNAISYTVSVATWRDAVDNLWAPNTMIRLLAPGSMIYKPYDFVIRAVTFDRSANSETATLEVVVPGSFTEENIGGLPWDE